MAKLRRRIGVFQGVGIAVGMVVGSGIFGLPGLAIEKVGPHLALWSWIAISLMVAPMIYVFMRLGMRFPEAGGLARYAEAVLGRWAEYGVTAVLLGTYSIGIPALAIVGAAYLQRLLHLPFSLDLLAFLVLAAVTLFNVVGVRAASTVNTVSLLTIFALIAFLGIVQFHAILEGARLLHAPLALAGMPLGRVWKVLAILFWAYLGWENLSFGLEEFEQPRRTIPRVYWGSYGLVVVVYLALAMLASGGAGLGLRVEGISGLSELLPERFRALLLLAIVAIVLANANSWVFGASRLVFAAARSGILFRGLAVLDSRGLPVRALLAMLVFYGLFLFAKSVLGFGVGDVIALVSQNFIVLYLISLFAFARLFAGALDRLAFSLSLFVIGVMLSGFRYWLVYPLLLMFLGYTVWRRVNKEKEGGAHEGNA